MWNRCREIWPVTSSQLPVAVSLRISCGRQLPLTKRARRLDEASEQRMPIARRRAELGMELAGDEERMRRQFDHLDQSIAREAGEPQASVHEFLQIAVVEFVTMAMTLGDDVRPVNLVSPRAV